MSVKRQRPEISESETEEAAVGQVGFNSE